MSAWKPAFCIDGVVSLMTASAALASAFGSGAYRMRRRYASVNAAGSARFHEPELTSVEAISVASRAPSLVPALLLEVFEFAQDGLAAVEVLLLDSKQRHGSGEERLAVSFHSSTGSSPA